MPFSTFSELKQEIISYTHRSDLDNKIQDFITLAEKEMFNNPEELLQNKFLEKTSTASTSIVSRFLALPPEFEIMRGIRFDITDESDFLSYRAPQQMRRYDTSGRPLFYTIIGTQIEFDRVPDEVLTIEIQYKATALALTEAAPTNTLLTNNPEVYLYGALYRAFRFAQDRESAETYKNDFYGAIKGANKSAKASQFGTAPVMRPEGSTP